MRLDPRYTKDYPTQGDLAREQLRRRGVPYFADVQIEVGDRLKKLRKGPRTAFALACADRLLRWHEHLRKTEQNDFSLSWRPVLDEMWPGLATDSEEVQKHVRRALDTFHAGPYDHDDGPDRPDDADEDAAASCIYACQCYLTGDVESACWSASRAVDLAFRLAGEELKLDPNDFEWDPAAAPMPLAREAMHPAVQEELRRQVSDLELLERDGVTPNVLLHLRQSSG
jgi:hypothetical protein